MLYAPPPVMPTMFTMITRPAIPQHWVTDGGDIRLCVAKGTLVRYIPFACYTALAYTRAEHTLHPLSMCTRTDMLELTPCDSLHLLDASTRLLLYFQGAHRDARAQTRWPRRRNAGAPSSPQPVTAAATTTTTITTTPPPPPPQPHHLPLLLLLTLTLTLPTGKRQASQARRGHRSLRRRHLHALRRRSALQVHDPPQYAGSNPNPYPHPNPNPNPNPSPSPKPSPNPNPNAPPNAAGAARAVLAQLQRGGRCAVGDADACGSTDRRTRGGSAGAGAGGGSSGGGSGGGTEGGVARNRQRRGHPNP